MAEDRSGQYLKVYKKDGTFVNVGAKGSKTAEIAGLTGGKAVTAGDYQVAFSLDNVNKPSVGDSEKVDVPAFTPADVPSAPTIALVAGDAKLDFTITKPTEHGSVVTGYTITYTPVGGTAKTQETTMLTGSIASLTNDTEYTVKVIAHSEIGDSSASTAVKATPVAAG